jgi:lipid-binding SYLF domain-containing protein
MRLVNVMKSVGLVSVACLFMAAATNAGAEWQPDPDDKAQGNAYKALARLKERIPRTEQFFEEAYGYAVLPSVTRVGIGFGAAYGRGLVVEGDQLIGRTGFGQFTSGIQAGAKVFSLVVFFKDQEALQYFKEGRLQFMGQAGLALGAWGANGTPSYNEGVAIFAVTRIGLMGEFTISGARFSYKDLP